MPTAVATWRITFKDNPVVTLDVTDLLTTAGSVTATDANGGLRSWPWSLIRGIEVIERGED